MQDIYDCTVQYIIENQNKFYRLAYSYVKEEQAALDVIQNAICRALESCFGLKNPLALRTWFYRILVRNFISNRSASYQTPQPLYIWIPCDGVHLWRNHESSGSLYECV